MSLSDVESISDIDFNETNEIVEVLSDKETNNDENEEFLAYFTKNLSVTTVIHTTVPIEYPRTSLTRVATIYNITGWSNPVACFNDIQYSTNGSGGTISIKNCPFLGTSAKKNERKCQGIKHCQYASTEFVNEEHECVDFDSESFKNMIAKQESNTVQRKTYSFFLAAQESKCKFKFNGTQCSGKAALKKIKRNGTSVVTYIIGCEKYIGGEKWHRYMKIPDDIDLILLTNLFNGIHAPEIENNECTTIFPLNTRRKTCDFSHTHNGEVVRGNIVEKQCNVKFIKFIPHDLVQYPYIALICIGVHNHPPPSPNRTPAGIKDNLQSMVMDAIGTNDATTARSLTAGNLIRAYFDKNTLPEVHASLNNVDKLRYLVGKCYKTIYPHGQSTLGLIYSVKQNISNLNDYVQKIEIFPDGQTLIVCMLKENAYDLQNLESFQIDVSFKRVQGIMNEFEINRYDEDHKLIRSYCRIFTESFSAENYHRLFTALFEVITKITQQCIRFCHINNEGWGCVLGDLDATQAKGLGLTLANMHSSLGWEDHLMHVFKSCIIHFNRNIKNKPFSNSTKQMMYSIPDAKSAEEVYNILEMIEKTEEPGIKDWVNYYKQPYVLSSLNKHISKMNKEIWNRSENNTNHAEASHANANRDGKNLKLLTAIKRGHQIDNRQIKISTTHDNTGVPYTRRDRSEIKRKSQSITRKGTKSTEHSKSTQKETKGKQNEKRVMTNLSNSSKTSKRKEISSDLKKETNTKKKRVEQENDPAFDEKYQLVQIEIEERKMALQERATADRKAQAEIEKLELENIIMKRRLESRD